MSGKSPTVAMLSKPTFENYRLQIIGASKSIPTDNLTNMSHKEHITQGKFEVVEVKGPTSVKVPDSYVGTVRYTKDIVLKQVGVY